MTTPDLGDLLDGEFSGAMVAFEERVDEHWDDLVGGLRAVYPDAVDLPERVARIAARRFRERGADLRELDDRRLADPGWFGRPGMLGYAAYTDRFAGTLAGVAERADYLSELGVTYLHLLPLLKPRPGENDGGYAVMDFRAVRDDLGDVDDLRSLATTLRERGISLTLDLVLNHVAAEHEWVTRAREGDERYRAYFHLFADRELPDAFEASLPEVFPDFAPGNFTWDDGVNAWVWTTFNVWQWDLNWANPDVFCEFADLVCWLANLGIECLRLDAIAFIAKQLGTSCQGLPEVHQITRALRAVARIAAPALIFKAEAIVGPADLMPYLGEGELAGTVSDLAYQNSLMVQIWSALATKETALFRTAMQRFPATPPGTAWATYLRCHDDIGWAIDDADAESLGLDGHAHRQFLADWYSGAFEGSEARGETFQEHPVTRDRRTSGTAASLCGIESALATGDDESLELAVRRLLLAHHVILGFGGLPLIWMGDELALRNDHSHLRDPDRAGDNRWLHRPSMPWDVADRRHDPSTLEHRVWHGLRHAAAVRAALPAMDASVPARLPVAHDRVLIIERRHRTQVVLLLHNVTPDWREVRWDSLPADVGATDALTGQTLATTESIWLAPYQSRWLT